MLLQPFLAWILYNPTQIYEVFTSQHGWLSVDAETLLESNSNKIDWNQYLRHLSFDWILIEICLFYKVGFERKLKIQKTGSVINFRSLFWDFRHFPFSGKSCSKTGKWKMENWKSLTLGWRNFEIFNQWNWLVIID